MGVRRRTYGGRLRTPAAVPIDSRRFPAPGPTHRRRGVSPGGWLGSGLVRSGVERLGALDVWALRARAHFSPGVSIRGVEQAMSMLVPSARDMVRMLASAYPDTDVCVRALPWRCRCCERITPAFGLVHVDGCVQPVYIVDAASGLGLEYARDLLEIVGHPLVPAIKVRTLRSGRSTFATGCVYCDTLIEPGPVRARLIEIMIDNTVEDMPLILRLPRPEFEMHLLNQSIPAMFC